MTEAGDYADKIVDAIEETDRRDYSMFYVQSFTVAESGDAVMVATWDGNAYQYRTIGEQG